MLPPLDILLKPRPRKYRNLVKHLSPLIFKAPELGNLTAEDIFNDLSQNRGTDHFLGIYSRRGIELVFEKVGFFSELERKGIPEGTVTINTSDPYKHVLRILHPVETPPLLSCELVMRQGHFSDFRDTELRELNISSANMLIVEWLLLQNPRKTFSRKRLQLPGQEFPGLGVSSLVFELLYWAAKRSKLDGIILVPNYLHTGLFYGRYLRFFNPRHQGILTALERTVKSGTPLDQLSWACAEGHLLNRKTESRYQWEPAPMVMPVSNPWKTYFRGRYYQREMKRTENDYQFQINPGYEKKYNHRWMAL